MIELVNHFEQALLSLDKIAAKRILIESQLPPVQFIEQVVIPSLERVGQGWERGTIALSQVYMSGRICEDLVDVFLPPGAPDRKDQPKMSIAVLEDYHLLGKRIVYSVLRASGFELLDYGRVEVDGLVRRVREDRVQVLLLSTLMLPSALHVKDVRAKLNGVGLGIKIIVGGAPFRFDERLWQEVGADAMGLNTSEAVSIVAKLVGDTA
jgi:methanogenic corrinoid protein MtbC1